MSNNKFEAPQGPPPNYPQQPPEAHRDAGPYYPPGPGSPPPNMENQMVYPQQSEYYGQQVQPWQQEGPPPQGYYGQQGPMYYQQQGPPQGYYGDNRGQFGGGGYGYQQPYQGRNGSAAEGICAGLLGALACCCCLNILF